MHMLILRLCNGEEGTFIETNKDVITAFIKTGSVTGADPLAGLSHFAVITVPSKALRIYSRPKICSCLLQLTPAQPHGKDIIYCTCKAWESCCAVGGFSESQTSVPNLLSCVLLISCRFRAAARSHHAHAQCNGYNHNTRTP